MAEKQRLYWIDTTKAICIICVYYAHSVAFTIKDPNIKDIVTPFYVNTFFFISGYLLYKKYLQNHIIENFTLQTYWNAVKNFICRIVVPTIIFSFIISIPKAKFHNYTIDYRTLFIDVLGGCSFWFTSALAVAQIVILTLFLTRNKNIFFYLVITALIFLITQYLCDFTPHPARFYFPWYWRTGLIYTFIITLGGLYSTVESKVDLFLSKGGIILIAISCIIIYVCVYSGYAIAFLGLSGKCTILGFIGAISSILLLIYIIKRCKNHNITDFIGKNSIIFYFLSGAVPNTIATILKKFIDGNVLFISTLTSSIIISYMVTLLISKYTPFLMDIRKFKGINKTANNDIPQT